MTDWIAAARLENQKKADRPTAKTAETPVQEGQSEVSSVLAVPHPPISRNPWGSPRVELVALIQTIGRLYGYTDTELAHAKEVAFSDPMTALASYREVASRHGLEAMADDRVMCGDCSRLVRTQCQAAATGLMPDSHRGYAPVPDVPRRCDHFILKAGGK